ncbi:MAG: fibronectin type III domain-containing protein, partial [Candidatus Omnitrophica bacterium]|nr:fibronectin type III domain-containing protein [Candidatus Omnitrophota bacterium]
TWTTNEASDSQVQYRVQGTTTWTNTTLNTSLVTSHSVNLTGLNASTTYEYQVKSRDQAGNLEISTQYILITDQITLQTGLISHYEFTGNANDSSTSGLNGTLVGDPVFVSGPIGNALQLDGVDDYVNVANSSFSSVTDNFTIALWVNPTTTHQIDGESTSGYPGTSGQRYAIYPSHGTVQYGAGHAGAGISVGTNGISVYEHADAYMPTPLVYSASLSGWNHVVIVYENKQPRLYLNGILVRTGLTSSKIVHPGQDIGEDGTGYGYFSGSLDDVRIYNRKLSAEEISELANVPLPDTTPPTISAVASSSITSSAATITWTTNEASDSQVQYRVQGQTTWTNTTLNTSLVTSHSVSLTGLNASTTYEYQVKSKDQAGNLAIQPTISNFLTQAPPPATAPFQESGGLLVIEAEHPHANISRNGKSWTSQTTQTGFAGEGYFWAGPDTGINQDTNYTTLSPELQYQVQIQTTGTYYVWVRGYGKDGGSDSVHVGLDGVGTSSDKINNFVIGSYSWTKSTWDSVVATVNITTTGTHTLNVWMREDGFIFDKILLTQDPNFIPSGLDPQESARFIPDTTPPVVALTSTNFVTNSAYTLTYTNDGNPVNETLTLQAGENVIHRSIPDPAGNVTEADFLIYYAEGFPPRITNTTPSLVYTSSGEIEKAVLADGRQIHYNPTTLEIELLDSLGALIRTLALTPRVQEDAPNLLSVTLQGGTKVFYEGNQVHHITFEDGTFVQNVVLDTEGKIKEATVFSGDGRILLVYEGILIREIAPTGLVTDYTPQGLMVREIPPEGDTTFYYYEGDSETVLRRIWTRHGGLTISYDTQGRLEWVFSGNTVRKFDSGILKRIATPEGILIDYTLTEEVQADGSVRFQIELQNPNLVASLPESIRSQVQIRSALFDAERSPLEITLLDNTTLFFSAGLVTRVINPLGEETTYDYQANQGLLLQLGVNQTGVRSEYDSLGDLSRIVTTEATFKIENDQIASLDPQDGSQVTNLTLDTEGNVTGATILDLDGTTRTYVNQEISQAIQPDGSVWNYQSGLPVSLTTGLNLQYEFIHNPGEIRANLLNVEIADASSPVELVYDTSFNLQWMRRKNNEMLYFQDKVLQSRVLPDGT